VNEAPRNQADQVTGSGQYEIRVKGHLAPRWAAWFDGMTLTAQDDGTTVIHATAADQAALHGLLHKLADIGLPLLSVTPTAPEEQTTPRAAHSNPERSTT
jgi:hypothetical protein